ncbi:Subtilisin-like protease SBT1.2 [Rhynchospora pubera]|uniref:Subtilisin-like protease SBT1.2 n=1 Tax=Rhynchospora pubera TaxID=906938 RepID=A0AAV8H7X5_9POAL|nr:Subtilisin-like protease SBT1.2 [Rhynchospora pubera]
MEPNLCFPPLFLTLFLFLFSFPVIISFDVSSTISSTNENSTSETQIYIVRVQPPPNNSYPQDLTSWYESFLPPNLDPKSARSQIIHSYSEAIIGFAAELTSDAINYMKKKEGFLRAFPDEVLPLLTTHTPDFLGLHSGNEAWHNSHMGKGTIVGLLDSGVWPGHPSFDDSGIPSPPSRWKGSCHFDKLACNKKLIGAKSILLGGRNNESPIDNVGHGTHTASTAAGNFVQNANVLGCGNGTAVGMAPKAHLAIYKVCESWGCSRSDVLAGIDEAIKDGVDVLSISLGGASVPFYEDTIAIGAYSAIQKGIFVSCSAGNSGPSSSSIANDAPWILTVGASTMDRKFRAAVKLGDGQEFLGESLFQLKNLSTTTVVYPGSCMYNFSYPVKGKIVVCDISDGIVASGNLVKQSGGVGMILINQENNGFTTLANLHQLPASHVDFADGISIKKYIKQSKNATASITFEGTSLGNSPAPTIAFFSSRGPSKQTNGILKPDIVGPGVNVLAAWPHEVGPNSKNQNNKTFNVISGTSMSAPHLSGVAALIKSMHPNWSPAAIKSAIMTTADVVDHEGKPIMDEKLQNASFFSMGAGHVNPIKAVDPGLVYDIQENEYIGLLCALGYTDAEVEIITQKKILCEKERKVDDVELNYPSITVSTAIYDHIFVNRTVTNVGKPNTKYTGKVVVPKGVSATVSPKVLEFSEVDETQSFTVSLKWPPNTTAVGSLTWISNEHIVWSPIVIF